ncbi:ATP-binding cassette domain-containing protein [Haliea sp.]|uniref:ABC transporter ATP-binding protein n=1 Tax=Haliea sp. TaxID=1932666 RepID=UPI00257AE260|nr:ATP-binding cassette domain-containing protein [Haliea sp.]|tara:strand:- start:2625 stop:3356 length:732 start_codon:yes stop_codon:yes gene_type:complete
MSRSAMLELVGVSHHYLVRKESFDHGVHHVLDDVSLQVLEGETLGIVGRNGAGKTTLLRLMAGILEPRQGRIRRRPGASCALLSLGLGFQDSLSGRDNALLSAMLQGVSKRDALASLEAIREFTELGDSFDEPVKTYSSGMRARLGFASGLLTHVDILLIDEVLSVGDADFRNKALAAMRERVSGEQTVVFVSHAEAQVKAICDRAVWIEQGRICAEGTPAEVIARYREPVGAPTGGGSPQRP